MGSRIPKEEAMKHKTAQKHSELGAILIPAFEAITRDLQSSEKISDKFTVRRVQLTVGPALFTPEIVKDTRRLLRASQAIFANFLGVSVQTVRAWEQGANPPSDMACRFLDEIRLNPPYWQNRLKESMLVKS